MNYKARTTRKETSSRRTRKGLRNTSFIHNKGLRAKARRARRAELKNS